MTAALIAILSLTVLGIPILLAVDRRARGPLLIGTSFLYGSGAIYFVMLALSIIHLHWTLMSVTIGALVIFSGASIIVGRKHATAVKEHGAAFHLLDLVTLLTVAGYALYATLASL